MRNVRSVRSVWSRRQRPLLLQIRRRTQKAERHRIPQALRRALSPFVQRQRDDHVLRHSSAKIHGQSAVRAQTVDGAMSGVSRQFQVVSVRFHVRWQPKRVYSDRRFAGHRRFGRTPYTSRRHT